MGKLGRVGIVVAARAASSRLPGKAMLPLNGMPMIVFLLRRLRSSRAADAIIVATTERGDDDAIAAAAAAEGMKVFRGSEDDVVARYVGAADAHRLDTVVRVTGDCPFVDGALVDHCLDAASRFDRFDVATTKGEFPVGLDAEIYPAELMADAHRRLNLTRAHREHLTLFLYEQADSYAIRRIEPPAGWRIGNRTFTVDTRPDYDAARVLADRFAGADFSIDALVAEAAHA
jgi:spore coat polysaccharide biosynthesis protein SpsF